MKSTTTPIYVHLDCDVLGPSLVPTEYRVPGGLSLQKLHSIFCLLAERDVVGLEIAEFESSHPDSTIMASPLLLLDALPPAFVAIT
jgi:arginase